MDKLDSYFALANLSTSTHEVVVASTKLTGSADIWWWAHKKKYPINSKERIQTWDTLKTEITKIFTPANHGRVIRSKLRELKQTTSVATYNTEFLKLSMQLSDLEESEATLYYLTGIKEEIGNYVV